MRLFSLTYYNGGLYPENTPFKYPKVGDPNALMEAGKDFEAFYYPNRAHGIWGGNARMDVFSRMTRFLEEESKGDNRQVGEN